MSQLILASTSPYRRELMSRLGFAFQAMAPSFDEESAKNQAPKEPKAHAAFLARGKAASLAAADRVVIGGDQLVELKGQILGKPKTFDRAVKQLLAMRGCLHQIHTAVCVQKGIGPNAQVREWVHTSSLQVRATLSKTQIEAYVHEDQPLDCAGSYKFEKKGFLLFDRIDCDDFSAIQGLPLLRLTQTLLDFGWTLFSEDNHEKK